jgi:hypothetical protein
VLGFRARFAGLGARLRARPVGLLAELAFALLALAAVVPIFVVDHPPIQDLPQHLAAVRIIHDFGDARFAFERYFELALGRTQYLTFYFAAHLLAHPFGVELATKLVLASCIVATPYAMRALLRALAQDQWLGVLVLPLTYNAHLILGFLNFVAAIPLALWGLALAVRQRLEPNDRRLVLLAAVLLLTFYTHVVPFAFLALGYVLVMTEPPLRRGARSLVALAPAAVAALLWALSSPAGRAVVAAGAGSHDAGPKPQYQSWGDALRQAPEWLTDVLHSDVDEQVLVGWVVLVLLMFAWAEPARPADDAAPVRALGRRVAALSPAAALLYFVSPTSYDWIWPINARFPLLCLLFVIVLLPRVTPAVARVVVVLGSVLALVSFQHTAQAFQQFEQRELGELDRVVHAIPEGRRVAGLIWDKGSRQVKFSPLLHAVAWYQVKRGGAVMFTFADFPQSPVRFRDDSRPPRVPPRWEWLPQGVDPDRQLVWYDYVITRGGPGRMAHSRRFRKVFQSGPWAVWQRGDQPPM